jgi:phage gpG-like protein
MMPEREDGLYVDGERVLVRHMDRIVRDLRPGSPRMRELMTRVGNLLVEQTQRHVDEEIDVEGRPFVPLSPATAEQPRRGSLGMTKRGYDHILRDYGTMLGSVQPKVLGAEVRGGPVGALEQAKGIAHQLGDRRRHLPKREWLGLRDGDYAEIADEVDAWVREVLRGE